MLRQYSENNKPSKMEDIIASSKKIAIIYKTISITLGLICLFLMITILIIAGYPKSQGYVIEIASDGSASLNSDAITLLENWTPAEETKQHFLSNFITELRSVSSDPQIVQTNIDKLYSRVIGDAIDKATSFIKETDPKTRLKSETVTIKIASILPVSNSSYQIDFRETVWSSSKRIVSDIHYRCIVHTKIYTPRTKKQALYNPIGLYVSDFTITEVKEI